MSALVDEGVPRQRDISIERVHTRTQLPVSPASKRPFNRGLSCRLRNCGGRQLGAHLVDGLLVVVFRPRVVEDGRSRHEHVRARLRDFLDVGHAASTVNLLE